MVNDVVHHGLHSGGITAVVQTLRAGPDVLGPRPLRTLAALEGDSLSLAQIVEPGIAARGVVEEILIAVAGQNEAEAFVADQSFDRAVHGCHGVVLRKLKRGCR